MVLSLSKLHLFVQKKLHQITSKVKEAQGTYGHAFIARNFGSADDL